MNEHAGKVEGEPVALEPFDRILLIGDAPGVEMLVRHADREKIAGVVGATTRPQYLGPLTEIAHDLGVPFIRQPRRVPVDETTAFVDQVKATRCDALICNSYSMLIPERVLDAVQGRAVNFHGSLLPRNRGPNPVQWAIIKGEKVAGVTAHLMVNEVDAGPILDQRQFEIESTDTWVTAMETLRTTTDELMAGLLPRLTKEGATAYPQDHERATVNTRLARDSPRIDLDAMSDQQVYDLIRAQVSPLAGAFVIDDAGRQIRFTDFVALDSVPALRMRFR